MVELRTLFLSAFLGCSALLVPSFADAQIGGMWMAVKFDQPTINVVVNQNGEINCRGIAAEGPLASQTAYLAPQLTYADYATWRFRCGSFVIDYHTHMYVREVEVVNGQSRPKSVSYETTVGVIPDGAEYISVINEKIMFQLSEGTREFQHGFEENMVPGIVFYGSTDHTTWSYSSSPSD